MSDADAILAANPFTVTTAANTYRFPTAEAASDFIDLIND